MGDNLVMLNTTPDEEMLQERVTREVDQQGAEAQKVSKMDDKVTMYYTITAKANNLAMIIFIQTSSKTVVRPLKTSHQATAPNLLLFLSVLFLGQPVSTGRTSLSRRSFPSPSGDNHSGSSD